MYEPLVGRVRENCRDHPTAVGRAACQAPRRATACVGNELMDIAILKLGGPFALGGWQSDRRAFIGRLLTINCLLNSIPL
jgi:hypothetical protein